MTTFTPDQQLTRLIDAVFDDQASAAEIKQLEELVLASPEHVKYYAHRVNEHATMMVLASQLPLDSNSNQHFEPVSKPTVNFQKRWRVYQFISTMTLGLLVGLGVWWVSYSNSTFARITNLKNVTCTNTELPIKFNTRLGQGRFKIESGIITVLFDSHAEMVIEGPAEVELIDSLSCVVYEGRVITTMPKGESGFVVRTSFTEFHDLGTKFGVCVTKHGTAVLDVFEGIVDANHLSSGKTSRIQEGERYVSSLNKFSMQNKCSEDNLPAVPEQKTSENSVIQISTNNGAGKDATIIRDSSILDYEGNDFSYPSDLLMLKNSIYDNSKWDRKVYLKFDMSFLKGKPAHSAKFRMNLLNSQIGYASKCPDSVFAVYGVHEDFETWPADISWDNAPAAHDLVASVDNSKAVLLGKFKVQQGSSEGFYEFASEELKDFINQDNNQSLTLIVVRETTEFQMGGIVHCFAGSQTLDGIPPTLVLEVEPD